MIIRPSQQTIREGENSYLIFTSLFVDSFLPTHPFEL